MGNCSGNLSSVNRFGNTVICNGTNRPVAIFGDDENLRNAMENCATHVVAPVEGGGNIFVALRRGIVLSYTSGRDCGVCEISGGKCGFDADSFSFRCFCHDGPYPTLCLPMSNDILFKLGLNFIELEIWCLSFGLIVKRTELKRAFIERAQAEYRVA
ncbi:hypothetical protein RD792_016762 [Penstemon davidsonii]|uniref:Wall-associated receptor kinase C-terminal domain-containing protein n=1 Tax=Penstemon davidsonii TaxID=160366 RepID=A0ABR0CMR9_9LAMI|nr:hypothetical protein RD792_016762 [Penstemon davidsonii]